MSKIKIKTLNNKKIEQQKNSEKKSKLILNVEIYKIKRKIFYRFFSSRKLENLYHDKKTSHGL